MKTLQDARWLAIALLAGGCVGNGTVPLERFARRPGCYADSDFTVNARFTSAATAIPFTQLVVRKVVDTGIDTVSVITPRTYVVPSGFTRLLVHPAPDVAGLILGPALEIAGAPKASR